MSYPVKQIPNMKKREARYHMETILMQWEGIPVTVTKRTIETDPNGKAVAHSDFVFDTLAIISSYSKDNRRDMAGYFSENQKVALFLYDKDNTTKNPDVDDLITENIMGGRTYIVLRVESIDWDLDEPVNIKLAIQEFADGS